MRKKVLKVRFGAISVIEAGRLKINDPLPAVSLAGGTELSGSGDINSLLWIPGIFLRVAKLVYSLQNASNASFQVYLPSFSLFMLRSSDWSLVTLS